MYCISLLIDLDSDDNTRLSQQELSNVGHEVANEQDYQEDDSDLPGKMEEKTMSEEIEEKEVPVRIFKRKIKKTKFEKSIEVLSNGFCAAAEKKKKDRNDRV